MTRERRPARLRGWTCPLPLRDHDRVVLGHGGGGKLSAELSSTSSCRPSDARGRRAARCRDAHRSPSAGGRLAFSTDSYVVRPLFFPGGCIGDLAVHGTVNDVAMSGAVPIALSAGFILEEGLELATLGTSPSAWARRPRRGVPIVTGDTKVVEAGLATGCTSTPPVWA
jgi:hydrogenase expression/formation protein HypE